MAKKIEISEDILKNYYVVENLSSRKIAHKFGCDHGVILRRLKEYNLHLRPPKKKIFIDKSELYNLYINKKLSTQKIAKILKISSCSVYYKLKEAGVITRSRKIINISKSKLKELYFNKKLSCVKIAKKFNCNSVTIFQKLKYYNIQRRSTLLGNLIYPKDKFIGNNLLKAYMIGFRLGDLNVKARNENSTIMVKSNTTKLEQCELIKRIYGGYGHYKLKTRNDGTYCIWINLDKSFSFLIPKLDNIEGWILNNDKVFFSFLAGYTDAEGNISISKSSARFRIRTYDKNILYQIYRKLNDLGINAKFGLASKKGFFGKRKQNQDCWGVYVYSKNDLLNLLQILKPLIKHRKRYKDLILAEENILERIKKYRARL